MQKYLKLNVDEEILCYLEYIWFARENVPYLNNEL